MIGVHLDLTILIEIWLFNQSFGRQILPSPLMSNHALEDITSNLFFLSIIKKEEKGKIVPLTFSCQWVASYLL